MKKLVYLVVLLCVSNGFIYAQSVGVNTMNPHASAALDVSDTTKGFLVPRMNEIQRQSIPSPAAGLMVYQTNGNAGFYYFNGSGWIFLMTSLSDATTSAKGILQLAGDLSGTAASPAIANNAITTLKILDGNVTLSKMASSSVDTSKIVSGGMNKVLTTNGLGVPTWVNKTVLIPDTASLSNRINTKLTASDTASLSNRINTKLNSADTASLSNRINNKLTSLDTASLSNRINIKLNSADTASLSNRINTKLTASDTASLSNRINTKLNSADTASLLNRINTKLTKSELTDTLNAISFTKNATRDSILLNINGRIYKVKDSVGLAFFRVSPSNPSHIIYNDAANYGKNFLVNTDSVNYDGSGIDAKMMFIASKSAFRAGAVDDVNWNRDSIGLNSFATGYKSKATGDYSIAMGVLSLATAPYSAAIGNQTTASGWYSTAIGNNTIASGQVSTAMGDGTKAQSYGELAVGTFNDNLAAVNATAFAGDSNRVFTIGNGTSSARKTAFVVQQNGYTGINTHIADTTLHVKGGFKYVDGQQGAGKVLTSDVNGVARWAAAAGDMTSDTWATVGGVTSSATDVMVNGLKLGRGAGGKLENTALGNNALSSNTSGINNTAVGNLALMNVTSGSHNAGFGTGALRALTTGSYNSAFGLGALDVIGAGEGNAAFGYASMVTNNSGNNNSAYGTNSLRFGTTGSSNTALGFSSLVNANGNNNTAIGFESGNNNSSGSGNVFLGYRAGYNETGSNKLYIANSSSNPPLIYGDFSTTKLGIGTTAPTATFHVAGSSKVTGNDTVGGMLNVTGNTTLTSLTTTNLAAGALTDSIVTINSAGVMRKSSLTLGGMDNSRDTWATVGGVTTSATDVLVNSLTIGRGNGNTPSNTALGWGALLTNTTGTFNTATGESALRVNTTGSQNTANGFRTLYANTTGSNNTANGYEALYSNTTGVNNTSTGYGSLFNNTGGSANTANGVNSLSSNTTGSNNTANGTSSLFSNTTGNSNTANGLHSLYSNTTGSENTANGMSSLYSNTTGVNNVSSGYQSLYKNTTGGQNSSVGTYSMFENTTGGSNTAMGYATLNKNKTGEANTAVGYNALFYTTSGNENTGTGRNALHFNTTGTQNTATGSNSLLNTTTGQFNTANGYATLSNNTTGNNNTALGYTAGNLNVSGSGNVFLGYQAGYNETGSNKLYIANSSANPPLIYGDFANGQLGFGTSSLGLHKIVVSAGAYANTLALFSDHPTNNEMFLGKSNNIDKSIVMGYNQSLNYGYFVVNGDNPGTGLVIGNDSKVGIGTTAPTTNFHVVGSSKVTGNDTIGGMLNVSGNTSLTSLTATNLAAGALTDSIVTINSAGVMRKSSLALSALDTSNSNEIQALTRSNDTVFLSNGGYVKLPEQKTIPALITEDDFSYILPLKNFWNTAVTGPGSVTLSNSAAVLSTSNSTGSAKLYSNKQKAVTEGKLIFTAVLYTYEDNNTAYGPLVRGLVNGVSRNNAIEFINISGNTIQARTVSGGVATTTNYAVGASVANNYSYTIIASSVKVEFYLDGTLIATHTTNIPTVPLNMYFDASTTSGNVPQAIDKVSFEIIRN